MTITLSRSRTAKISWRLLSRLSESILPPLLKGMSEEQARLRKKLWAAVNFCRVNSLSCSLRQRRLISVMSSSLTCRILGKRTTRTRWRRGGRRTKSSSKWFWASLWSSKQCVHEDYQILLWLASSSCLLMAWNLPCWILDSVKTKMTTSKLLLRK